jgi:tripartite-type tricarboxylate transporter receptor subunit TctC
MINQLPRRAALLAAVALACGGALAQTPPKPAKTTKPAAAPLNWPTKTVRIMVGFPGGSTPDLVARTIAEPLSKALGQPVVVENRVGAGGNIAADVVAKATDDHTIGVMINGNMTIAKMLNPATPFDPLKDLAPISLIGTAPLMLTAPATAPFNNAQEFFLAARNAGDKWSYGTPGVGTVGHIGMELLKTRTNINPVHVPYLSVKKAPGGQQPVVRPPAVAGVQADAALRVVDVAAGGVVHGVAGGRLAVDLLVVDLEVLGQAASCSGVPRSARKLGSKLAM